MMQQCADKPYIMKRGLLRIIAVLVIALLFFLTWFGRFENNRGSVKPDANRGSNPSSKGRHEMHINIDDTRAEANVEAIQPVVNEPPMGNIPSNEIHTLHEEVLSRRTGKLGVHRHPNTSSQFSAKQQLLPGLVPPNVHFMWCGKRWFEFKHYLSITSAIRALQPDKVVFHYEHYPEKDKVNYNLWITDLVNDFPFFIQEKMSPQLAEFCQDDRDRQIELILQTMSADGGLYIGENTWLLDFPPLTRMADFVFGLEGNSVDGIILLRREIKTNQTAQELLEDKNLRSKSLTCSTVGHLYNGNDKSHCMIVKGGKYNRFWPMDIWDLEDAFGRLCRRLFYGTEDIRKPVPTYNELVPNIGHMIWIGGGKMDFVFYLSVLSLLYIVKVDVVYIHGDKLPKGEYWQKLVERKEKVQFIYRDPPQMIYQGVIEPWYRALMSDIIRVDLMIKYGGIYTDTDAIWVKPLSQEDRGYDAVASFDWVDWSFPYPDSVNFGLSYGKKNAPFWRIFRDSMRRLDNEIHGFTGVMMPYKLLEKYPHLLRIDRHLQVICYQFKCHPIYVQDYHNMSKDHTNMGYLKNWKEDVNALHWTHPNPTEYKDQETLLKSSGMFADIGRFVLEKAGLI